MHVYLHAMFAVSCFALQIQAIMSSEKGAVIPPQGRLGESEYSNRISNANLLIVFHSNYGSILLSFLDVT